MLVLLNGQGQRRRRRARWAASSDVSALWHRSERFTQQSISILSFLLSSTERPRSFVPVHHAAVAESSPMSACTSYAPLFSAFSEAISGSWELVFLLRWWVSLPSFVVHQRNIWSDFAAELHWYKGQRWHHECNFSVLLFPFHFHLFNPPHTISQLNDCPLLVAKLTSPARPS